MDAKELKSRRVRTGVSKRRPSLPAEARGLLEATSKSELLEAAWHLASLANEAGSCDDHDSTRARLIAELNNHRAARGARPVKP